MRDSKSLADLLADLRDAELDRLAHHQVRHPTVNRDADGLALMEPTPYHRAADPKACEADWAVTWRHFDDAVRALINYALATPDAARECECAQAEARQVTR